MHSGFGWLGESSLYSRILLLVYQQQAFPYGGIYEKASSTASDGGFYHEDALNDELACVQRQVVCHLRLVGTSQMF
jgi:hypothetical protein